MKKVKFYFKLEAIGSLENVFFCPEKETTSIILKTDSERKEWLNEQFELMVENPFEYTLTVFGVTGTHWEAELKIINGDDEKVFLEWKGITGDTKNNFSIRNKPTKNV
ncbi:hypothetical protein FNW52_18975 [Flavobacterium sp. ZT3R18]|uniref:hypothetical protein n=1 Tax=Flavobacterium sp. ZT3R18 TaxID=2594429 RepID=UPI001179F650|nr:hypothetical protein [Flavobacterium sp. ZT3R18]TRX31199.1 hypothetical protein FNW52_18975 [Flavobacterium sp. ZT3R18]